MRYLLLILFVGILIFPSCSKTKDSRKSKTDIETLTIEYNVIITNYTGYGSSLVPLVKCNLKTEVAIKSTLHKSVNVKYFKYKIVLKSEALGINKSWTGMMLETNNDLLKNNLNEMSLTTENWDCSDYRDFLCVMTKYRDINIYPIMTLTAVTNDGKEIETINAMKVIFKNSKILDDISKYLFESVGGELPCD